MKKNSVLFMTIFATLFFVIACNEKKEVDSFLATQGYIRASINSQAVSFGTIQQKKSNSVLQLSGQDKNGNSIMLVIGNPVNNSDDLFDEKLIGELQVFPIGLVYQNGRYTANPNTQELKITQLDRTKKLLKGTFKFSAPDANTGKEIVVTEGSFEINLIN